MMRPITWGVLTVLILASTMPSAAEDHYAALRRQLVDTKIRTAGVTDSRVLAAIGSVPRHEFVPREVRDKAYLDMALPIGDSQTISSPFIVASMTEVLQPEPSDKVLEIGTGSGYQAAVLSGLVAEVYSIEIVEELGRQAERTLSRLGYTNIQTRIGDGFLGWPEASPFDKIIVTCSPEAVPQNLIDQLREGGSMVIPVGERYQQTLYRMTKTNGKLIKEPLQPTLFVPMTGTAEDGRTRKPDAAHPAVVNGGFEELPDVDEAPGYVAGWYYGRQVVRVVEQGAAMARFENRTPGLGSHLLQGIALDGTQVSTVRLSGRVRTVDVRKGPEADALSAIAISFYDDNRNDLGTFSLGPFRGTKSWREVSRLIKVPPNTREAILRIGLFGATGKADFDRIRLDKVN